MGILDGAILIRRTCRLSGQITLRLLVLGLLGSLSLASGEYTDASSEPMQAKSPLERGLTWLAKAQERESGGWISGIGYKLNTGYVEVAKGEPHVGVSALVLLAFLEAGHLPGKGPHGELMRRGTDFLLACQRADGSIQSHGTRMTSHAYALQYLARLASQNDDEVLKEKAQKAVQYLAIARGKSKGWHYQWMSESSDLIVTSACILALRSAHDAGLEVSAKLLQEAEAHVAEHLVRDEVMRRRGFSYQASKGGRVTFCTTAAGLLATPPGELRRNHEHTSLLEVLVRDYRALEDVRRKGGHYFLWYARYLGAQALHEYTFGEAEAKRWADFKGALRTTLHTEQRADGSWPNEIGPGPAFATAVACSILQS